MQDKAKTDCYYKRKYFSVKTALGPSEASQSQAVKEWELRLLRSVVSPHFYSMSIFYILAFYLNFKVNLIRNFLCVNIFLIS